MASSAQKRATSPLVFVAVMAAVLALGAWLRLANWNDVFTAAGVRFIGDTDPHYHVLRAERLLHGDPDGLWIDRNMSYPDGARILWPPGWDRFLAGSAVAFVGRQPSHDQLERVAAIAPVVIGLLAVLALVAFARGIVGTWPAVLAALLAAVLPVHVEYSILGRPDQHVGELLVFTMALLAFERAARPGASRGWLAALGGALALGPWVWQGSALTPGVLAVFVAYSCVLEPAGPDAARASARALGWGSLLGALVLGASLLAWGPPDAITAPTLNGLSAFQPASLLAVVAFVAAFLAWDRRSPAPTRAGRIGRLVAAGAVPLVALAAIFPGAVGQGIRALVGADPWLASIGEYRPVLFGGLFPASIELKNVVWGVGTVVVAPLVGIAAFRRRWSADEAARNGLALLALGTALFLVLTFRAVRFKLYAGAFLPIWGGLLVWDLYERGRSAEGAVRTRLLGAAAAAGVIALAPAHVMLPPALPNSLPEDEIQLLEGMGEYAAAQRSAGQPERAVMAPWPYGHVIQYYAHLPVVVTPFGTDLGQQPMRDLAAFYYAPDAASAEDLLRRRHVGYVLLPNPYGEIALAYPFAPPGSQEILAWDHSWLEGQKLREVGSIRNNVVGWLWQIYGAPRPRDGEALVAYRLLFETPDAETKLFELVEGARVRFAGAPPGQPVVASVQVITNRGRRIAWSTEVRADPEGAGAVRIPYATGWNGAVRAGRCLLTAGTASGAIDVPPAAVVRGDSLAVDLRAGVRPASRKTDGAGPG